MPGKVCWGKYLPKQRPHTCELWTPPASSNSKGAERAIATQAVTTLGFPYSISPSFLERNQKQTPEEALEELEMIQNSAIDNGLNLVAYVSMAFGNPYGDLWSVDEVIEAVSLITDMDIRQVSLADTVGRAGPEDISHLVRTLVSEFDGIEFGVHLHSRPDIAQQKILAAFDGGCRRFDSALGGLGGCPFAQDALVGNIATEHVLAALKLRNAELPQLKPLEKLIEDSAGIGAKYLSENPLQPH
jgi:hydroxymethylglutaryl-CoA lyase